MDTKLALAVLLLAATIDTGHAVLCPYGGWVAYGNSCYYFYKSSFTRTWADSRLRCASQDADLVTIETTRERDWLLGQAFRIKNYTHNRYHQFWTGINARPDGSTWKALNNTHININLLTGKWVTGHSTKSRTNQCVLIVDNKFYVTSCNNRYQAICERPANRPLTCDPGWTLYNNMCYKYYSNAQGYTGAQGICHRGGGSLPEVFDAATQNVIWDLAKTNNKNLWIGLKSYTQGSGYVWKWTNSSVLGHTTFWNRAPPTSLGSNANKMCVEQSHTQPLTHSWNPTLCTGRRSFFCQKPEGSCPNGWLQYTNRCYLINARSSKSFTSAQSYCSGLGANLAALDSAQVGQFLWTYVHNARRQGATYLWIGLTDYNSDAGPWRWTSRNRTLGHWLNWNNNRATNSRGHQDCVFVDSNDHNLKWRVTTSCRTPYRFICQLPTNKALTAPTTPPPVRYTCKRGYRLYSRQHTCIQLNSHDSTWDQARLACQKQGADLVTITNANFNNFISSIIRTHRGKYWIGLEDRSHEGNFLWATTNTRPTFTNWQHGQPNNQGNDADCVSIYDNSFKWYDISCSTKLHYICQIAATVNGHPPTTTTPKPFSPNCGPMWEDDPNSFSCYMFNTERLSWLDARSKCQSYGGDLVSIGSIAEQFYINGRIARLNSNFFWVGANDRRTESGWRWSDNSALAFIYWRAGQPDNHGNADCVGISRNSGQWSDFQCTDRYAFVCEKMGRATPKPTRGPTSPATVPHGKVWGCPRNWRGFGGQCYQLVPQPHVQRQQALMGCGFRGGNLVSIHSDAENKFVLSLFPRGYTGTVWIGLTDSLQEGSFMWSDASAVTYTRWNNREPNNLHDEDCVVMTRNGGWLDYQCKSSSVAAYICKKPMGIQNKADIAITQNCTSGLGFRARCYAYINSHTRTWSDAQRDCHSRHGNLATVDDMSLQAFVAAELVYRPGQGYWIGLKNVGANNKTYMWSSGADVDYTAWSEKHTGNELGTCVGMAPGRPVGLWTNFPCNTHLPYICEYPRPGFTTPPPTPPTTTSKLPCPHGWKAWSNICIMAFNLTQSDRLSWMESRDYCRGLGGDLTSIWNKRMEAFIIKRVLNNATTGVWWIGLNDRDSENGHVWSDDHGVAYTNWQSGEPNDYNNREDCVEWIFPANGWNDDDCYVARNFMCSVPRGTHIRTTAVPPTAVTNSGLCQNSSWLYMGGECYFLSPEDGPEAQLSWYDARRTCHAMNAELVSVHGEDENGFLTSAMSRHAGYSFWLGLNDLDQGDFSWTDGTAVNYVSWRIHEPNDDFGGESCVESFSNGLWNDENCQDKNSYICKKPMGNATPYVNTLAPVSGGCPTGYTSISILDKCYKVAGVTDDTRKNYTDAMKACTDMLPSGKLVSIHHYLEQRYVMTLTSHLPHYVWIGLNDVKRRNDFEWVDNSEVHYTHWGGGQPDENLKSDNPDDRRDCVAMNPSPRYAGNWNDMMCSNRNHYICQTPRVSSLPTLQPSNTGCTVSGYSRHGDNCYRFYPSPASWTAARQQCQRDGGDLITLSDRFQVAAASLLRIPDIKHAQNVPATWIGLNMPTGSSKFQWANMWPVTITRWADSEPDNDGGCVSMDQANKWHDGNCTNTRPFLCQISLGGPPPTTTTVSGSCPDSTWIPRGEYCYKLTATARSWPNSRMLCQRMAGASLASVHSQDEMDFVKNTLLASAASQGDGTVRNVWLGLYKEGPDGFGWVDGTELEYDHWAPGEPSDTESGQHQDCVQASLATGLWNDVDCLDPNYYVCKMLQETKTTLPGMTAAPGMASKSTTTVSQWRPPNNNNNNNNPNQPGKVTTPRPAYTPAQGGNNPPGWQPVVGGRTTAGRINNTPLPQTQTGNSGGGGSGMSGGAVAGVVLGTLGLVAVLAVAFLLLRGRVPSLLRRQGAGAGAGDSNGFDNALYSKAGEVQEDARGSVSFGFDGSHTES